MQTFMRNTLKLATVLMLVLGLFGAGFSNAQAASLPASSACTSAAGSATCNLWAKSGSFTPPGGSLTTIWGFTDSAAGTLSTPGGPVLVVNQGDVVTVNLTNNLTETTALLFQGQAMKPDLTGVTAGGTKTYTFTASQAGTFLYEAGLIPGSQHQVAMGLYGALVVRPAATGQAYADPATAFDEEALLVLSELDPALNNSATPATFDMRKYHPQYFLINGKAFPNTAAVAVTAGNKVLLRYVNAGLQAHAMSTLGLTQTLIAQDGSLYASAHKMVAETIATGQTLDTIVTIPAAAVTGTKYALYDANMQLHNSNTAGMGGMLTFITVGTPTPPTGDVTGPATGPVALSPNPTNGTVAVTVSASISDVGLGDSNIAAAEFYIDSTFGSPTAMSGVFGSTTVSVNGTISTGVLGLLASTNHTIYVRGQDSAGNWGPFASVVLNLDKTGPTTSALGLAPNPANGTAAVNLTATANDSASGNNNITAAEYFIDAAGTPAVGTGTAMTVNLAAPTASLSAAISAGTVNALSQGSHTIKVRSMDILNNWGVLASITLKVDKTGPVTSGLSASPSANNGTTPVNTSTPAVRVSGTFNDGTTGSSNIAAAEGFIDAVGTAGTGFAFVATDGTFNNPSETGYGDIPLAVINTLSNGNHTIYVHAKDAAGNWGAYVTLTYLIDRTAPTFTSITLNPTTVVATQPTTLTVNGATDPLVSGLASGVSGGEYWFGTTNPAPGSGTQFSGLSTSIPTGSLAVGTYTVRARVRDVAGNWSTTYSSSTLTVIPDAIFSNGFETGSRPWGWTSASTTNTGRLDVSAAAALFGTRGLQAQGGGANSVQYDFGTTANPATGTFDARFYFNPNSNTGSNQDIFVARTTGGATVFRVRYRWNSGAPQVQIQIGTGTTNLAWTPITNGASNRIEVVWQSGGTLQLYVGGSLVANQTLTATATSVGGFRMGSVTSGGNSTLEFFDAFSAKRLTTPYGP